MAHGTSTSTRANARNRRSSLSSSASPSEARNCSTVTETAQIRPMRNDAQKSASASRSPKFASPTKDVTALRPDLASVKARKMPYSSGPTLKTSTGTSAGSMSTSVSRPCRPLFSLPR